MNDRPRPHFPQDDPPLTDPADESRDVAGWTFDERNAEFFPVDRPTPGLDKLMREPGSLDRAEGTMASASGVQPSRPSAPTSADVDAETVRRELYELYSPQRGWDALDRLLTRLHTAEAERDGLLNVRALVDRDTKQKDALRAERNRYKAALERIENLGTDWTDGPDGNLMRAREVARGALANPKTCPACGSADPKWQLIQDGGKAPKLLIREGLAFPCHDPFHANPKTEEEG